MADNDKDLKLKVEKNDENNPEYREYHVKKAAVSYTHLTLPTKLEV